MSEWGFCLGRRTDTKCTLARYCSVRSTCISELLQGSGEPLWDVGPDSFPKLMYGLNCFSEIATSRSCTGDTLRGGPTMSDTRIEERLARLERRTVWLRLLCGVQ